MARTPSLETIIGPSLSKSETGAEVPTSSFIVSEAGGGASMASGWAGWSGSEREVDVGVGSSGGGELTPEENATIDMSVLVGEGRSLGLGQAGGRARWGSSTPKSPRFQTRPDPFRPSPIHFAVAS